MKVYFYVDQSEYDEIKIMISYIFMQTKMVIIVHFTHLVSIFMKVYFYVDQNGDYCKF